jgi:hypothetical protein
MTSVIETNAGGNVPLRRVLLYYCCLDVPKTWGKMTTDGTVKLNLNFLDRTYRLLLL